MRCMVPSEVLGDGRHELLILDMRDIELVLRRRVLRWVVVGISWCWVGVIAGLQRGRVAEVCRQVWLNRRVVNVRCYMGIVT